MSSKSGIRSLVCDSNGIIVAEMVYRCMICSAIHDVLDDAQRHYQSEHIDDNDNDCKTSNQQMIGGDSDLEDEEDLSLNFEMQESMYEDMGHNQSASNSVTVSVPASLRQLQYQSLTPNNNSESMILEPSMDQFTVMDNRPNKPITFAQPSNSFLMPFGGTTGKVTPKRVGGGFVTCEVCGLTKYYSHISRRYGVFSCESCAKFFYRYLLKPSKFVCANNGNCSLKIDVPGGRCKSCLLQACLQKYIIDPKKHPKIFQRSPATGEKGVAGVMNVVPANVQIKINPKPKQLLAKPNIKQEISLDGQDVKGQDPSLTVATPKPSTNGIVIKATPAGSGKRKQQFNEDGVAVTRSRRIGCRECPGCLADDCGQCLYCLDKPKFGGNDVKKQRCIKRRCHRANYT